MSKTAKEKEHDFILKVTNIIIATSWIYHGIIPKLLYMETGELELIQLTGFFPGLEEPVIYIIGIAETIFGLLFVMFHRKRVLHFLNILALILLVITAYSADPYIYLHPFNPFTTSIGIIGLSMISLHLIKYIKVGPDS